LLSSLHLLHLVRIYIYVGPDIGAWPASCRLAGGAAFFYTGSTGGGGVGLLSS